VEIRHNGVLSGKHPVYVLCGQRRIADFKIRELSLLRVDRFLDQCRITIVRSELLARFDIHPRNDHSGEHRIVLAFYA
jgi:hypothetical protein